MYLIIKVAKHYTVLQSNVAESEHIEINKKKIKLYFFWKKKISQCFFPYYHFVNKNGNIM